MADDRGAGKPTVNEAKAQPYGREKERKQDIHATSQDGTIRRPSQLVLARLSKLERKQKGQIAAIEMGSQEIFVGKDVVEATLKGWKKYPRQSFYFVRIGYPVVHRHRGGLRKR
jgi:hypothetical protein